MKKLLFFSLTFLAILAPNMALTQPEFSSKSNLFEEESTLFKSLVCNDGIHCQEGISRQ